MSHFPSDTYTRGAANRDPEEEAMGWVVRLTSGDVTEADVQKFEHWQAEPENALCYERARRLWVGLGPIIEKQEAAGWPTAQEDPLPTRNFDRRSLRRIRHAAIAASFAVIAFSGAQYHRIWQYDHVSGSTVSGGVTLADGSEMTLGPGSAVNVDFGKGARHVSLSRGEAYFDVRHDPAHPFVVSSGNGLVRVLGTAFSVRHRDDGSVTVTVARGRVEVTSGARTAVLTPDRQISFDQAGLRRMHAVDASFAAAWMRGRLIMENKPLAEVLAELDRYRGGRIVLVNSEAGQRRINAVIDLGRTDSWLTALASSQGLTLNSAGPITILR